MKKTLKKPHVHYPQNPWEIWPDHFFREKCREGTLAEAKARIRAGERIDKWHPLMVKKLTGVVKQRRRNKEVKEHKKKMARLSMKDIQAAKSEALQKHLGVSHDPTTPRIKLRDILKMICREHRLDEEDVLSHKRNAELVRARHEAFWLAKKLTHHSLPAIGRFFNGRDHTSIMHGIKQYEKRVKAAKEGLG